MTLPRHRLSLSAFFSVGGDGVKIGLRGRSDGLVVSPAAFVLVARFAEPTRVEDVLADQVDPEGARQAIDELVASGVLVADSATAGDDAGPHHQRDVVRQLDDVELMIQRLAGDLHAIGPHGPLASISHALELVLSDLLEIQTQVDDASKRLTQRQLEQLAINGGEPLKLHIGAGGKRIAGWINIDIHPAELSANLARPLPFADRSVAFIYSAHTFEHLVFPDDAYRHLAELRRVLKPDGVLRLVLPDIEALARAYVAGQAEVFAAISGVEADNAPPPVEQFLAYAGAPVRVRDRWYDHKFGYDFHSLSSMLVHVGFRAPKRCGYQSSVYPELRLDDRSAGATISIAGRSLSLFIEATPDGERAVVSGATE